MTSGLLLLDKPAGMTSAKTLNIIKRRLNCRKIGHAGTLDPMATGLLVCLTGSATRLAQYAAGGKKRYSGVIQFGLSTTTDDIEGEVVSKSDDLPPFPAVEEIAAGFLGEIQQIPPQVSAIKFDGVRGYEMARRGREVPVSARTVSVERFSVSPVSASKVSFDVICSKGTYIRALARDIGKALGCGACLAELRRLESHPFNVSQAKLPEEAENSDIMPWWHLFPDAAQISFSPEQVRRLRAGDQSVLLRVSTPLDSATHALYGTEGFDGWSGLLVREAGAWKLAVNIA